MMLKIFTKEEIRDLIFSVFVIAIIFSFPSFNNFFKFLLIVIISFIAHELSHKFMAMRFNCIAFYKIWLTGIIFGLIFMFVGIKFVAPGAVIIYPFRFGRWRFKIRELTRKEEAIIASAGPLANIMIALIALLFKNPLVLSIGFINSWLALFNLLPIPPLDGSRVIKWNPFLWFLLFLISLILFLI